VPVFKSKAGGMSQVGTEIVRGGNVRGEMSYIRTKRLDENMSQAVTQQMTGNNDSQQ